ncbi:MAG: hypothetical protein R3E97_04095 [Candidatus Eisenbacteria bacterium]
MTTIGNPAANYSLGTQINRALDSLGYPDAFGDALGALVDLRSGNVAGAFRNLVDLNSGLSTRQMDSIFGGARRPGFARAFAPRCHCNGGHLHAYKQTYAVREQVGKRAHRRALRLQLGSVQDDGTDHRWSVRRFLREADQARGR